jgi:DNA-binding MarR family transcriptional regulator
MADWQTERERHLAALMRAVHALAWQGNKLAGAQVERIGLTVPQMMALGALDAHGGRCAMHDLARSTHSSGATLTGIVDRLIAAGLVIRERSDDDRRVVTVVLTEAGRERLARANQISADDLAHAVAAFDEAELAQFTIYLNKLLAGIESLLSQAER